MSEFVRRSVGEDAEVRAVARLFNFWLAIVPAPPALEAELQRLSQHTNPRARDRAAFYQRLLDEAREAGEIAAYQPTPANAALLRDVRDLRWERVAIRIFGDPLRTADVRQLYDQAKGAGASRTRWGAKSAAHFKRFDEEARAEGELGAYEPTPENILMLRDQRGLRWERIAARVFGDAARRKDVRQIYEETKRSESPDF